MLSRHHRLLRARYMLRYLMHACGRRWDPSPQRWNSFLPNAFILGGKRCGTRQLKTLLMQHPAVYSPKRNDEVRFFDRWDNAEIYSQLCMAPIFGLNKTDRETMGAIHYLILYAHEIKRRLLSRYAIRLDKSVNYLFFPGCAEAIHKLVPTAKLIVVLRDPTKRAISDYYFNCNRRRDYDHTVGYPSALTPQPDLLESVQEKRSIDEALGQEDKQVTAAFRSFSQGVPLSPRVYDILRVFGYRPHGLYAEQLKRYTKIFPARQILIIRSERLFADPILVARKTLEFLSLDPSAATHLRKGNNIGDKNATNYTVDKSTSRVIKSLNDYYAKPNKELESLLTERRKAGANDLV